MSTFIALMLTLLAAAGTTIILVAVAILASWVMLRSPDSPSYTWSTLQDAYALWTLPLPDPPSQTQGEQDF